MFAFSIKVMLRETIRNDGMGVVLDGVQKMQEEIFFDRR